KRKPCDYTLKASAWRGQLYLKLVFKAFQDHCQTRACAGRLDEALGIDLESCGRRSLERRRITRDYLDEMVSTKVEDGGRLAVSVWKSLYVNVGYDAGQTEIITCLEVIFKGQFLDEKSRP
ncbi:hypothetical protein CVT26_010193, partial [Gymnopilus dilepis]